MRLESPPAVSQSKLSACPVCAGSPQPWRTKITNYGRYAIDTCASCGFGFVNPRPSIADLRDFYATNGASRRNPSDPPIICLEDLLQREAVFPASTLDASRLVWNTAQILADTTQNYRLLDVGCGFGFRSREAREAGFEVTALEFASPERGIAAQLVGTVPLAVSFEDFVAAPNTFCAILMSEILLHAPDVNLWISKAARLLIPRGVMAIALPNFGSIFARVLRENEPLVCPPAHLNFFAPQSLRKLLERHGFQVKKTQWTTRITTRTIEKHIPKVAAPMLGLGSRVVSKLVDSLHMGQILTMYAERKEAG